MNKLDTSADLKKTPRAHTSGRRMQQNFGGGSVAHLVSVGANVRLRPNDTHNVALQPEGPGQYFFGGV